MNLLVLRHLTLKVTVRQLNSFWEIVTRGLNRRRRPKILKTFDWEKEGSCREEGRSEEILRRKKTRWKSETWPTRPLERGPLAELAGPTLPEFVLEEVLYLNRGDYMYIISEMF